MHIRNVNHSSLDSIIEAERLKFAAKDNSPHRCGACLYSYGGLRFSQHQPLEFSFFDLKASRNPRGLPL
jgi:hypothetical protein